jgi:hypothetical protein
MRVLTTAHGTLERAAHIIEQRGWIQKEAVNANGVCLVQALQLAAEASTIRFDVLVHYAAAAVFLVGNATRAPYRTIMHWNDDAGRTQQEVTAVLRKAAEIAKEAVNHDRREPTRTDLKRASGATTGANAVALW